MKYKVIKEYNDAPSAPIQISKGEELVIIKESDSNGDWPNWIFCKGKNKEGWVPRQIISIEGTRGKSSENYIAKEFNLTIGEILISNRELNGWIWGNKENEPDDFGWASLNCLEKV